MIGKLKCFIGWHNWTWTLTRGEALSLDQKPPPRAKCSRCGANYGRDVLLK